MKHLINIILLLLFTPLLYSQNEQLVVEGAIVISDNDDPNPVAGTIRWTGSDFEGFDGTNWISLTCCDSTNTLPVDCDGNVYDTVHIGSQIWLKQNLRATCYNEGTLINFLDSVGWDNQSDNGPFAAWPNYTPPAVGGTSDVLYNWYVGSTSVTGLNVCPVGYHVPSDSDWSDLVMFLDPTSNGGSVNDAGGEMKTIGTFGNGGNWESPNTGATNNSRFCGDPTQKVTPSGFNQLNRLEGFWWSTDINPNSPTMGVARKLKFDEENARKAFNSKSTGFPIRCIKD